MASICLLLLLFPSLKAVLWSYDPHCREVIRACVCSRIDDFDDWVTRLTCDADLRCEVWCSIM
jgi:hypothetical protein